MFVDLLFHFHSSITVLSQIGRSIMLDSRLTIYIPQAVNKKLSGVFFIIFSSGRKDLSKYSIGKREKWTQKLRSRAHLKWRPYPIGSRIFYQSTWATVKLHRAGKIRSPGRHLRPKNIFGDEVMGRGGQFGDQLFDQGSSLATPVLRSVPCANKRYCMATGKRTTADRFPKTKFKISETFLGIRVTLILHTLARTPAPLPPPPPPSNKVVPFFFLVVSWTHRSSIKMLSSDRWVAIQFFSWRRQDLGLDFHPAIVEQTVQQASGETVEMASL